MRSCLRELSSDPDTKTTQGHIASEYIPRIYILSNTYLIYTKLEAQTMATSASKYVSRVEIESTSRPGVRYVVAMTSDGTMSCSCPAWIYNRSRADCKHIRQVRQSGVKILNGTQLDLSGGVVGSTA